MPKKVERNLIAGLDIGTSKVVAIIGSLEFDGSLDIVGVGIVPSRGMRKGVVVNIDETAKAIQQAIEEAEAMAGCRVHSVYTGISGNHIRSFNSNGIVAIRGGEVSPSDVERVIDAARAVAIPTDQKVLHVLPQEFIIDNQCGIRDPIGMTGVRLEVNVHIVVGSVSAAQNIVQCVRRCNLEVDDIVLGQLASSTAVVTEDERQLGVCLVDIGGGTTDVSIFAEGAIQHTAVIPVAGEQVTNDIAVAFRTPSKEAETIKVEKACAFTELANPNEIVEISHSGLRSRKPFSQLDLAEVVEPRFEELFSLVQAEIQRSGFDNALGSGVVLTGGSARMEGIVELAEEIFQMPVRIGMPQNVSGLLEVVRNPICSQAVGLLHYGHQNREQQYRVEFNSVPNFKGLAGRVKDWVQGYF